MEVKDEGEAVKRGRTIKRKRDRAVRFVVKARVYVRSVTIANGKGSKGREKLREGECGGMREEQEGV